MNRKHLLLAALAALSACAHQSKTTDMPIGISGSINGLQGSPCTTGKGKCRQATMPVYMPAGDQNSDREHN